MWGEGEGKLDEKGEGEIRFLPEGDGAFRYRVHCVVFDPAYRAVEKEEEVQVLMGEFYLSLQPRVYFVKTGETMTYEVEARDAEVKKVRRKISGSVPIEWRGNGKWRESLLIFSISLLKHGRDEKLRPSRLLSPGVLPGIVR